MRIDFQISRETNFKREGNSDAPNEEKFGSKRKRRAEECVEVDKDEKDVFGPNRPTETNTGTWEGGGEEPDIVGIKKGNVVKRRKLFGRKIGILDGGGVEEEIKPTRSQPNGVKLKLGLGCKKDDEINSVMKRNPQGISTARRKKVDSEDNKAIKRLDDLLTNDKVEDSSQSNADEERLVHSLEIKFENIIK